MSMLPLRSAIAALLALSVGGCWDNSPGAAIPDGRVAFTTVRAGGQRGISLATSGGHDERLYLNGAVDKPAWSPNGAFIAYERANPGTYTDILFVRVADGVTQQVTSTSARHERDPAWSPSGERIAYGATFFTEGVGSADSIVIATWDGRGASAVTPGADPSWAPDGRIAFVDRAEGSATAIWVLDAVWRRTRATVADDGRSDVEPAWGPDGRRAWTRRGPAPWPTGGTREQWSIMRQYDVGGPAVVVATDTLPLGAPAWSPDGTHLVITASWSGTPELWVLSVDGATRRRITAPACPAPCGNRNASWAR